MPSIAACESVMTIECKFTGKVSMNVHIAINSKAEYDYSRIVDTANLTANRLAFRPIFRFIGWDGHFRKNMSIMMGFIQNAEWSLNTCNKKWFDDNGNNVIP